jgi:hypothetical protein
MTHHEGGCLCGNIRFTLTREPVMVALCHCRNCQKTSGSAFSLVALVARDALAVAGIPETYDDTGDSGGKVERSFCGRCGSPIVSNSAGMAAMGMVALKASALDDTSWLKPGVQIYCDSEQSWMGEITTVPRVAKSPN